MDLTVIPGKLRGHVTPPASKSQAHRAVLALALSGGEGRLSNLSLSEDILATRDCVEALGSGTGIPLLPCRESGSTLRFLIPVALALRGGGRFTGRGRLLERPQSAYEELCRERGISWTRTEDAIEVRGTLDPGIFRLRGDISSQFVTGLLFALPLLKGDSEIVMTTPLESRGYVDMTLDVMEKFGVRAENLDYRRFLVPGNQQYRARDMTIEADWSQAAFWLAAKGTGSSVEIDGMNPDSVQGDRVILQYCDQLSEPGEAVIDVSQCPDLVPPLAVCAALRPGQVTRLVNAARLRMKESDRLAAVTALLNSLGGQVEEQADSLTIYGRAELEGGVTCGCCNDHRIAMMAGIAATCCRKPVTLLGADCVSKSYPEFWDHFRSLGGEVHVLVHG